MFNKKLFLTLWLVKATVVWMAWLVIWGQPADAQELVWEDYDLKVQKSFQDYTVRIYEALDGTGAFEILRNGRQVYAQQEGGPFSISSYRGESLMGKDITGDGTPDLVIEDHGGDHGDTYFHEDSRIKQVSTDF